MFTLRQACGEEAGDEEVEEERKNWERDVGLNVQVQKHGKEMEL